MAVRELDLRWPAKLRATAAFFLAGALVGAGLYFGNIGYLKATAPAPVPAAQPFATLPPPTFPGTGHPTITVTPSSFVNRGTYVVIMVTGSGFTRNGTLSVSLNGPDGGTFLGGSGYPVDVRGDFRQAFLWYPLRGMDNSGIWAWTFQDQETHKVVRASLHVTSNVSTPPQDRWPATYTLLPSGPPTVRVTTSGNLCTGPGELTQVVVSGFAPNASVTLSYRLPNGAYALEVGETPDALGDIDTAQTYWQIPGCQPDKQYHYTVLVQDNNTGRTAKSTVVLSTS